MPYEPIRCPTCASTKTIVSENGRFFCISCEGWFVWTEQQQIQQAALPHQSIESMHQELVRLRALVEQLQRQHGLPKQTGANSPTATVAEKLNAPSPVFSDAERVRQNLLQWFYQTVDGIHGPVSFDEVLLLNRKGVIRSETSISNDREKWQSFGDFLADTAVTDGLKELLLFFALCAVVAAVILAIGN